MIRGLDGDEGLDGISLPGIGDGHSNPIGGVLIGLGAAADCIDPWFYPRGNQPNTITQGGVTRLNLSKWDTPRSVPGANTPDFVQTCVHEWGGRPDGPTEPEPPPEFDWVKTDKDFRKALDDLVGKDTGDPPLTKEEMDELLATPAPDSPPAPPTDDMPKPDDGDGTGPSGPAYYPTEDGPVGGPAGRIFYPTPDGSNIGGPAGRFYYPKPDDIGPGGPAGRALTPKSEVRSALRASLAGQRYYPRSGSVLLPPTGSTYRSRAYSSAELLSSRKSGDRVTSATYLLKGSDLPMTSRLGQLARL